jgi:8-oxo-dGTP pyrophosphatase MutT (NUDIX family)
MPPDNPSDQKRPRPSRPKYAATLVLYRQPRRGPVEVLMGRRDTRTRFMPSVYVFPGGRVDAGDWRARPATPLREHVLARVTKHCSAARAQAHAMAAVRETFEETGLTIASPDESSPGGPPSWQHFRETGLAPDLARLDYFARALTPANRPIRYDARFFIADGAEAGGTLGGNGELHDLHWVALDRAQALPLPSVTRHVLHEIERFLTAAPGPGDEWMVSFFSMRRELYYHRYE